MFENTPEVKIDNSIERAAKAIREFLVNNFQNAMSKFNGGGNSWVINFWNMY